MMRIVHISDTQLGFTDSCDRYRLSRERGFPLKSIMEKV